MYENTAHTLLFETENYRVQYDTYSYTLWELGFTIDGKTKKLTDKIGVKNKTHCCTLLPILVKALTLKNTEREEKLLKSTIHVIEEYHKMSDIFQSIPIHKELKNNVMIPITHAVSVGFYGKLGHYRCSDYGLNVTIKKETGDREEWIGYRDKYCWATIPQCIRAVLEYSIKENSTGELRSIRGNIRKLHKEVITTKELRVKE